MNGDLKFRRRRVSLTFRRIKHDSCKCKWPFFCDSQGYDPVTMKKDNPLLPKDIGKISDTTKIVAPKTEQERQIMEEAQAIGVNRPTDLEKK